MTHLRIIPPFSGCDMFDSWSSFESEDWKLVFTPTQAMNKDQLLIKEKNTTHVHDV